MVEIFPEPEQQQERTRSILEHLISPGQEVGGDSRLLIPSDKNVVTAEEQIRGQVRKSNRLHISWMMYTDKTWLPYMKEVSQGR